MGMRSPVSLLLGAAAAAAAAEGLHGSIAQSCRADGAPAAADALREPCTQKADAAERQEYLSFLAQAAACL